VTDTDLSVIVTTHNRAELIDDTLAALAGQRWDDGTWDVVVVDNDSTDDTASILRGWTSRMPVPLRVVTAAERHGPSYARNTGVAHTAATSVAFVDDDDLVGDGWVEAIGDALRDHALVGSRYEYARLNRPDLAAAHGFQSRHLATVGGTPVVSGGGLGCHRDLWERVDGSDESLPVGEDIDFSLRASATGAVTAAFVADATYHLRLRTGAAAAFRRGRLHGRAAVRLHRRYGAGHGDRPDPPLLLAKVWLGYLARLPTLTSSERRTVYAEQLGRRVGRLGASFRERVWYP
jgi:glycosyltransferase involved in cell wall biosynthesis